MKYSPIDQLKPIRIIAIIEPNAAKGAHSFNHLLDTVRNWRGPGFRFVIDEHVHQEGTITPELIETADELWFFGTELCEKEGGKLPVSLTDAEIAALKKRMDAGVGVFATGDHEDIGSCLCEKIPRVGKMRVWGGAGSPSQLPPGSYESSLRSAEADVVDIYFVAAAKADPAPAERDTLPKPIWVAHRKGSPHELMQMPPAGSGKERIRFLPDHMHEGKLLDYDETDANGNPVLTIPTDFYAGSRPLVVARSIRTAFDADEAPSSATLYPVVSTYEPPQDSGWGNIVVDSTFHHWADSNALRLRLSPVWLHVEQYAINIAIWLLGEAGRNKIRDSVSAYLSRVESCDFPPAADDARNLTDIANCVTKFLGEQRIATDLLERILEGSVNDDLKNQNHLVEKFPSLNAKELRDLRDNGDLQRAVLGLRILNLRQASVQ